MHGTIEITKNTITIPAPRFETAEFTLIGTSPYMQARFSEKAKAAMRDKMIAGSTSRKGKKRDPRNFTDDYNGAMYKTREGYPGIPASAFRAACISACRLVGFTMKLAKLSLFVEADGYDKEDGTPLIKIEGKPEINEMAVRNASGVCDLRVRPLWREWSCKLRIRYDLDQFTRTDVVNLLHRVGQQVGIGEGRPDSRSSAGLGYGTFELCDGSSSKKKRRA